MKLSWRDGVHSLLEVPAMNAAFVVAYGQTCAANRMRKRRGVAGLGKTLQTSQPNRD